MSNPPVITWRSGSTFAALPATWDFGTINTGSSGSNQTWFIFNNYAAATSIANATSVSFREHDQGDGTHALTTWSPASGWLYVRGIAYRNWTGSGASPPTGYSTGSAVGTQDAAFTNVYSGSTNALTMAQIGTLSGSNTVSSPAATGSAWEVNVYMAVPNTATQGLKSGSVCAYYQYT